MQKLPLIKSSFVLKIPRSKIKIAENNARTRNGQLGKFTIYKNATPGCENRYKLYENRYNERSFSKIESPLK